MPVHQHGSGSIFNVYGDYNDYGPQINGQMGGPGMSLVLSSSKCI